ncbi:MAG: hypothetical protein U0271_45840, partial [Polyangiaceae bacterium]
GLYVYCGGNPVGLRDPGGTSPDECLGIGCASFEPGPQPFDATSALAAERAAKVAKIRETGDGVTVAFGAQKGVGPNTAADEQQKVARENRMFAVEATTLAAEENKKRASDSTVAYAVSPELVTRRSTGNAWGAQDIKSGADILEFLGDVTAEYGAIRNLVIYGHGTGYGVMLGWDVGLYADASGFYDEQQGAEGRTLLEMLNDTPGTRDRGARTLDNQFCARSSCEARGFGNRRRRCFRSSGL